MDTQHAPSPTWRALAVACLVAGVLGLVPMSLVRHGIIPLPTGAYQIGDYGVIAMIVPVPECSRDTRCLLADYTIWLSVPSISHGIAPDDLLRLKLRLIRRYRHQLHWPRFIPVG